jgi:hypothetical protein
LSRWRSSTSAGDAAGSPWPAAPLHDFELSEYLNWDSLASGEPPVGYAVEDGSGVGVFEAVREGRPLRPAPDRVRLDLNATT